MTAVNDPARQIDKERVALSSVAASGFMALTKLIVGVLTGSLGILAEAAHSLLDLGATLITYGAVRVSDRPPDREHPYGHAKIESISALAETALLFFTAVWIAYEAAHRLLAPGAAVTITWWALGIMVLSIAIDFFRARALRAAAIATSSQALEADALHFSSDMLSAAVVLAGLGLVRAGWPPGDAAAALGVSVFIALAGWRLGRRTVDTLIDTAPEGVAEEIRRIAAATAGIAAVDRVRVRPAGAKLFVDLDVAVSRTQALEQADAVRQALVARIAQKRPDADCAVHIRPVALDEERIADRVRLVAERRSFNVSRVTVHQGPAGPLVTLSLEVDGRRTLGEAHADASALEDAIRAELGRDIEVETHIEAAIVEEADVSELSGTELSALQRLVDQVARERPAIHDVHRLRARKAQGGLFVTLHCRFAPELRLEAVHAMVDEFQNALRDRLPAAHLPPARRVIVHAEPLRRAGELSAR